MRDGYAHGDDEDLEADIETDLLAGNAVEWILGLEEALFGLEVDELSEDIVRFDGSPLWYIVS